MKSLSTLGITTLLACTMLFVVCKSESHLENPYKEKTEKALELLSNEKYNKILAFASPKACTLTADWAIIALPSLCGTSHIPYHRSVDKTTLQNMINDYAKLMDIYQPMMAPRINCIAYQKPLGIRCQQGKAIIAYEQSNLTNQ